MRSKRRQVIGVPAELLEFAGTDRAEFKAWKKARRGYDPAAFGGIVHMLVQEIKIHKRLTP